MKSGLWVPSWRQLGTHSGPGEALCLGSEGGSSHCFYLSAEPNSKTWFSGPLAYPGLWQLSALEPFFQIPFRFTGFSGLHAASAALSEDGTSYFSPWHLGLERVSRCPWPILFLAAWGWRYVDTRRNVEWLLVWLLFLVCFHVFGESANIHVGGPRHLPIHHPVLAFFSSFSLPWVWASEAALTPSLGVGGRGRHITFPCCEPVFRALKIQMTPPGF